MSDISEPELVKYPLVRFIAPGTHLVLEDRGTWMAQAVLNFGGNDHPIIPLVTMAEYAQQNHKSFFLVFEDESAIQNFLATEDSALEGVRQLVRAAHRFVTPVVTTAPAMLKRMGALHGLGVWREQFLGAYFTANIFKTSNWVHDWYHDQIVEPWCFGDFLGNDFVRYRLIQKFKLFDAYYQIFMRRKQSTVEGFRCLANFTTDSIETHLDSRFDGEALVVPDDPELPVMFGSFSDGASLDGETDAAWIFHQTVDVYAVPARDLYESVQQPRSCCGGSVVTRLPVERESHIDVSIAA